MKFGEMLARNQAYVAPAVFDPLCAKLAEQAGFRMLYLSGGALGYVKCSLEANLSLTASKPESRSGRRANCHSSWMGSAAGAIPCMSDSP
jgi:hypothetical protein